MKTTLNWQTPNASSVNVDWQAWKTQLLNAWNTTLSYLAGSTEPRVWQTRDASGQLTWNAYDALRNQSIHRVSETELRSWLEELHYQN